jgi:hypothetical protein
MNEINLYESPLKFKDTMEDKKPVTFFKGHVVLVDDVSGEVILEKDNLVVLRGRTFALEKMFDIDSDFTDFNKTNRAGKKICMWMAGRGGCDLDKPFEAKSVEPDSRSLGQKVPFRAAVNGEKPEKFKKVYYSPTPSEAVDKNGQKYTFYYGKGINKTDMEWVTNVDDHGHTDEVALKLTLKITEDDFRTVLDYDENGNVMWKRDTFINEIALCIANYVEETDRMENVEIATRLTFASEPYFSNLKEATLYYYIYA